MDKKIVFCGGGNMAEGILRELLSKEIIPPENITVNEINPGRCDYLSQTYRVKAAVDAANEIKEADLVIIAVIPQHIPTVAQTLKPLIRPQAILLSIAAGVTIKTLESHLGNDKKIVRVMPNTLGQVMFLPEDMFNIFTGFSNVGPIWFYKMVEALIDAGVYVGFSRADARDIVLKNMLGVATILEKTGEHPAVKVDQMTSPGGVTIEALRVLQQGNVSTALMNSVMASVEKVNLTE